jgi:hypothetical protein
VPGPGPERPPTAVANLSLGRVYTIRPGLPKVWSERWSVTERLSAALAVGVEEICSKTRP